MVFCSFCDTVVRPTSDSNDASLQGLYLLYEMHLHKYNMSLHGLKNVILSPTGCKMAAPLNCDDRDHGCMALMTEIMGSWGGCWH